MQRVLLLSSFVLLVLTFEGHALAHAPPAAFVADKSASAASPGQLSIDSEFRYYGWQSLLADTLVFALGMGVHPLAFVLLVSTGPVVHAVNQNFLMMGISSGVRGLAALLFLIGGAQAFGAAFHTDSCHEMGEPRCEPEPADGSTFFAVAGVLLASAVVFDAALGFRRLKRPASATGWTLQPFAAPRERGAGLAFAGVF